MRRVADAIVERLRAHDTRQVFTVAGESYLDVLDALFVVRDVLHVATCRHEAAAANMAEATAKLTGRPGVAFVTRGPGLTHASIGVHTAQQDATPMVLFVGEIAREDRWRRALQESRPDTNLCRPAAIAAKLAFPRQEVIGDSDSAGQPGFPRSGPGVWPGRLACRRNSGFRRRPGGCTSSFRALVDRTCDVDQRYFPRPGA
jgi:hypothetical protein